MILFINLLTGDVLGTIDGRVHPPHIIEKVKIQPEGIAPEHIGKYVVPLEPITEDVEEEEAKMVPESPGSDRFVLTKVKKISKRVVEQRPTGPLADMVLSVEQGVQSAYDYTVIVENGQVTGFKLKQVT